MNKVQNFIFNELSQLSAKYPGDTIIDIIDRACDFKYPSRKKCNNTYISDGYIEDWKLTNEDIYKALKSYNSKK